MSQELWTAVDHYIVENLVRPDPVLRDLLQANVEAGLPPYDVAPNQGKFLHLLARLQGAKKILEIGTLGGYSTIWLARALPPDGLLVTLESEPKHASVAQANLAGAFLSCTVEIRQGPALESLARLETENIRPFDFVFIDGDKQNNPAYLEWALRLSRPGSIIVADNVVRGGGVVHPRNEDASVRGIRRFIEMMGENPRLSATAIQTVGSKGYDGFSLALVTGE